MSYCVNCGVELQKSEPRCPLCGTEVVNPSAPQEEKPVRPYPSHVERLDQRLDRRYIASFISLLMLIPLFTVMLANILVSHKLTWSYYVLGGELVAFTVFLLPMIARMPKILFVVIDAAAVGVLLLLIQVITQGNWNWLFLLGLPITGITALFAWFISCLSSPKCRLPILIRASLGLAGIGLLVVGIEFSSACMAAPSPGRPGRCMCSSPAGARLLASHSQPPPRGSKKRSRSGFTFNAS